MHVTGVGRRLSQARACLLHAPLGKACHSEHLDPRYPLTLTVQVVRPREEAGTVSRCLRETRGPLGGKVYWAWGCVQGAA